MTGEVDAAAVAANQTMDAGVAAQQVSDAPKVEAAPAVQEHQAPSVDEKLAAQNAANLQKAIEHGFKPEAAPSPEQRARTLVADMQRSVDNNGPITVAMMREVKDLLGVD